MTTYWDNFDRATIADGAWFNTSQWQITDGVLHNLGEATGFLPREEPREGMITVTHAENQASGKIGVGVHSAGVRLVCQPLNGWTWTLEHETFYVDPDTQEVHWYTEYWGEWDNQGPPAGRRTSLLFRSGVYDAYLDGVLLGRHVDYGLQYPNTYSWGPVAYDICTAGIEDVTLNTPTTVAHYADFFDRPTLGNAPNGEPYLNTDGWEIQYNGPDQDSNVRSTNTDNNQLVYEHGRSVTGLSAIIEGGGSSTPYGLVVRWADPDNFLAIGIRRDVHKVYLYQYENGTQYQIAEADTSDYEFNGQTFTAKLIDNEFIEVAWDRPRLLVQSVFNPTATKYGVFSDGAAAAFDLLQHTVSVYPAAVLYPGRIELAGQQLEPFTGLPYGRIQVHGGNLTYFIPPVLDTGAIDVTGSDLKLSDRLPYGRIKVHGSALDVVIPPVLDGGAGNPAPTGSGRYPIGAPRVTNGVGIVDEHGNVLADENDRVILLD